MEWGFRRAGVPIYRLRWEGEARLCRLDDAHDFEHKVLFIGHVIGFRRVMRIGDDGDIEARSAEAVEGDVIRRRVDVGILGEVLFDAVDDHFELGLRRRIEHAKAAVHFSAFSAFEVVDIRIGEHLIGHQNDGVFERADDGRTQSNFFDRALDAVERNPIADVERMVEKDDERTEEVGECVFCGECDGGASDAEPGDERRDREAQVLEHEQDADGDEQNFDNARDEWHDHVIDLRLGRLGVLRKVLAETARQEEQVPNDAPNGERAHADEDVIEDFDAPTRRIDDDEPEPASDRHEQRVQRLLERSKDDVVFAQMVVFEVFGAPVEKKLDERVEQNGGDDANDDDAQVADRNVGDAQVEKRSNKIRHTCPVVE